MSTLNNTKYMEGMKQSVVVSLWFMFLTFPIMVIRVNTIENVIEWRWMNMIYVGAGSFILSFVWRYLSGKGISGRKESIDAQGGRKSYLQRLVSEKRLSLPALGIVAVIAVFFPFVSSIYQTNIMTTALMYVVLGLGLNIVVGQAGLLNLGYVAFYAAGAYTYALLLSPFRSWFLAGLAPGRPCRYYPGRSPRFARAAASGRLSGYRNFRLR